MPTITPAQQTAYIQNHGSVCLYCESSNIRGDSFDSVDGITWQTIDCDDCGESWQDIYHLVAVEPTCGQDTYRIEPTEREFALLEALKACYGALMNETSVGVRSYEKKLAALALAKAEP